MTAFLKWIERRMALLRIATQQQLAEISGVSSRTVSRLFEAGTAAKLDRSTKIWLARTLKVSLRDLESLDAGELLDIPDTRILEWEHTFTGRGAMRIEEGKMVPVESASQGIPIIGRVSAGGMIESVQDFDHDNGPRLPIRAEGIGDGVFALEIMGDSMMPTYQPGQFVILRNIAMSDLREGEDAMIQVGEGGYEKCTFKRVFVMENGRLKLVALNPAYEPLNVDPESVTRVGRVLGAYTPAKMISPNGRKGRNERS